MKQTEEHFILSLSSRQEACWTVAFHSVVGGAVKQRSSTSSRTHVNPSVLASLLLKTSGSPKTPDPRTSSRPRERRERKKYSEEPANRSPRGSYSLTGTPVALPRAPTVSDTVTDNGRVTISAAAILSCLLVRLLTTFHRPQDGACQVSPL